jgi:hypothetical protein
MGLLYGIEQNIFVSKSFWRSAIIVMRSLPQKNIPFSGIKSSPPVIRI